MEYFSIYEIVTKIFQKVKCNLKSAFLQNNVFFTTIEKYYY